MKRHPGRDDNADLVRVGRMLGTVISIVSMLAFLAFVALYLFFSLPSVDG